MDPATVFGIVAQLVRCVRGRSGHGGHTVVTGAIVREEYGSPAGSSSGGERSAAGVAIF
jgi:hypothetical protein